MEKESVGWYFCLKNSSYFSQGRKSSSNLLRKVFQILPSALSRSKSLKSRLTWNLNSLKSSVVFSKKLFLLVHFDGAFRRNHYVNSDQVLFYRESNLNCIVKKTIFPTGLLNETITINFQYLVNVITL